MYFDYLKVDNRKLAKIAKLAETPENKAAGIDLCSGVLQHPKEYCAN
tara:strand:+ start:3576 stop:3716 length:141 start_codon:yes stop_codon:yes gene_type:complete